MSKVRYLQHRTQEGSYQGYYFGLPKDIKAAGILAHEKMGLGLDKEYAVAKAEKFNEIIDEWREQQTARERTYARHTIGWLADVYKESDWFKRRKPATKQSYSYILDKIKRLQVPTDKNLGVQAFTVGARKIRDIKRKDANAIYKAAVAKHGVRNGNYVHSLLRRMFNLAMNEWELIERNPFVSLDTDSTDPREVVWEIAQILRFYEKSVELGYRSIGLTAILAYDLMQRHADIRALKWDENYKVEASVHKFSFEHSKTKNRLWVPASPFAVPFLEQTPRYSVYICGQESTGRIWNANTFARKAAIIRDAAGLPEELQIRDLRRTAGTEGGAVGGTEDELKSVGGWKSRNMLQIYARPTYLAAENLQRKRHKGRNK